MYFPSVEFRFPNNMYMENTINHSYAYNSFHHIPYRIYIFSGKENLL